MGLSTYNGFPGPMREQVQRDLNKAWDAGTMPRPSRCATCGQTEGTIDAHLEDYSRPETYTPLCVICHLMVHCRFGRNRNAWRAYVRWIGEGHRPPPAGRQDGFRLVQTMYLQQTIGRWPGIRVNDTHTSLLASLPTQRVRHVNAPPESPPQHETLL